MKILIAEDDCFQRDALGELLQEWGYEVVATANGAEALRALQQPDAPSVAILDCRMPFINGADLCAMLRSQAPYQMCHLILLTADTKPEEIRRGLDAGADDYVRKPFDEGELLARIRAGIRSVNLKAELFRRVRELELATERIRTLEGILPVCSYCKKIRDAADQWCRMEDYISARSLAQFSHGVCPTCYESVVVPQMKSERAVGGS